MLPNRKTIRFLSSSDKKFQAEDQFEFMRHTKSSWINLRICNTKQSILSSPKPQIKNFAWDGTHCIEVLQCFTSSNVTWCSWSQVRSLYTPVIYTLNSRSLFHMISLNNLHIWIQQFSVHGEIHKTCQSRNLVQTFSCFYSGKLFLFKAFIFEKKKN